MSFTARSLAMLPPGLKVDITSPEGDFSSEIRTEGTELDIDIPDTIRTSRTAIAETIYNALREIMSKYERAATQANVHTSEMSRAYAHSFVDFLNQEGKKVHRHAPSVSVKFYY